MDMHTDTKPLPGIRHTVQQPIPVHQNQHTAVSEHSRMFDNARRSIARAFADPRN